MPREAAGKPLQLRVTTYPCAPQTARRRGTHPLSIRTGGTWLPETSGGHREGRLPVLHRRPWRRRQTGRGVTRHHQHQKRGPQEGGPGLVPGAFTWQQKPFSLDFFFFFKQENSKFFESVLPLWQVSLEIGVLQPKSLYLLKHALALPVLWPKRFFPHLRPLLASWLKHHSLRGPPRPPRVIAPTSAPPLHLSFPALLLSWHLSSTMSLFTCM